MFQRNVKAIGAVLGALVVGCLWLVGCGQSDDGGPEPGWTKMSTVNAPAARRLHSAVWTGSKMIVWGGQREDHYRYDSASIEHLSDGAAYDPVSDSWAKISDVGRPSSHSGHSTVWTGKRMIVWGGQGFSSTDPFTESLNTGSMYDPATDTWTPMSNEGAPPPMYGHSAVWTGTRMVVWGVWAGETTVGSFDPEMNTWSILQSDYQPPTWRRDHSTIWTGEKMIVWGGLGFMGLTNTGAIYDPKTGEWIATPLLNAPPAQAFHKAIWTGTKMLVLGGRHSVPGTVTEVPGAWYFDPKSHSWSTDSVDSPMPASSDHSVVWTGRDVLVWGGLNLHGERNSGKSIRPGLSRTTSLGHSGLRARHGHSAVWTGRSMIIWGGMAGGHLRGFSVNLGDGGIYTPHAAVPNPGEPETWLELPAPAIGANRANHVAVSTGSEMIVWGGVVNHSQDWVATGQIFNTSTNTWTGMSTQGGPLLRGLEESVWTGTKMLVWGGNRAQNGVPNAAAVYDRVSDSWSAMSNVNAPLARQYHTATWTGEEMIVWGGEGTLQTPTGYQFSYKDDGAAYDPDTDTWTPLATAGSGGPRSQHTAVWTGTRLIVWGGRVPNPTSANALETNSGSSFDPINNEWTPISQIGAPSPRNLHSAVWTGTHMIVWGGGQYDQTGGVYDPVTDTWRATSTVNAPFPRSWKSTYWTGTRMLVLGGPMLAGGSYDPVTDTWEAITTEGYDYIPGGSGTGVMVGPEILFWGGLNSDQTVRGSGYRYRFR